MRALITALGATLLLSGALAARAEQGDRGWRFPSARSPALAQLPSHLAGHVIHLRGTAYAERANPRPLADGQPAALRRALAPGDEVREGDIIVTGPRGSLDLTMVDGTTIALAEDGRVEIDSYLYDPDRRLGHATLVMLRGVFRVVTGALAQLPGEPLHIKTQTASLGIRGTDLWGQAVGDQLMVVLMDGKGVSVENAAGRSATSSSNAAIYVGGSDSRPAPPVALSWLELRQIASPHSAAGLMGRQSCTTFLTC